MKKNKVTKSLLTSILSLILCVSMAVGTTFAWFTDSVTSGVNKIVAGNLDIEVSSKVGEKWVSIQDSGSLFSSSLWEPGHTEYVTLKIENKGTLAFKYSMSVSPISETGGINKDGNLFKLSDYLVFKTTSASETDSTPANRDAARELAGTEKTLNQVGLTQSGTILPNGNAQYVTLVVYMPETVGNEANYKTGTTAPEIDLGIKVIATQLDHEEDSFGKDYDENVDYPTNETIIEYNYFPQINVNGQLEIDGTEVKKGSTAGTETSVTKIDDTTSKVILASEAKVEDNTAAKLEVIVNKGNLADDQTGSLTLKVIKDDTANANFQANATSTVLNTEKQDSTTYQVSVECEGVVAQAPETGKALYKVELFIGKNRSNVAMYHNGVAMTEATTGAKETYSYDSSTGYVAMYVDTFSPFTAVYDLPVAAIGTTAYYSLNEAVAAANNNETVIILTDLENQPAGPYEPSGDAHDYCYVIRTDKSITIDGNGHKITGAAKYILGVDQCTAQITIKNLEVCGSGNTNTSAFNLTGNNNVILTNIKASGVKTGVIVNNTNAIINGKNTLIENGAWHAVNVDQGGTYNAQTPVLTVEDGTIGTIWCERTGSTTITGGRINVVGKASGATGAIAVSGGTFNVNPKDYVVNGYKAFSNDNGTFTVKVKPIPVPDANGVFVANTNDDLDIILEELNTKNTYTDKPYTIKLGSGVTGATWSEEQQGYIANVYVIPQYINWKYNNNTGYAELIAGKKARITIIGDNSNEKLLFRGIFIVTGHGYSNGGDSIYDSNASTTIQNLNFDFTNVVGTKGITANISSNGKYSPIIACGACCNVSIDNCSFKNTERIKLGYSQNNNPPTELYNEDGNVAKLAGYALCTTISNCIFENSACVADGYPAGKSTWTTTNGKYGIIIKNVVATGLTSGFVNTQTGGGADIYIENCNISGSGYGIRLQGGNTALVKNTSIMISGGDNNFIAFKGNGNNTITLENVTIPDGGSYNINSKTAGNNVICKGTTAQADKYTKSGSSVATVING